MIANCSSLLHRSTEAADQLVETFRTYKTRVPVYGVILLDTELKHVLLVQGYYAKTSWGFPKGKVNEQETAVRCAVRETLEETGYDATARVR